MSMIFGFIDVETPKFDLLTKTPVYELRRYLPQIRAECTYDPKSGGDSTGFRMLAGFIFGKNKIRDDGTASTEIAMTAPVITKTEPTKIAMTAPVITAPATTKIAMTGPVTTTESEDQVHMSFVMPSKYQKISDLPFPVDPRVRLTEVPTQTMAVITFSGFCSKATQIQKEKDLREACKKDSVGLMTGEGSVVLARYNPPFTIPFLRTNEIMIHVMP
ncbi:regulatory factor, effector binding domain-containing protein [Chytridium lagenaria]|nr:regulatory factor, effector binding domain-containing protein [Chytridium lagenaria]